jgi:beta-glucanase (GH16 family)
MPWLRVGAVCGGLAAVAVVAVVGGRAAVGTVPVPPSVADATAPSTSEVLDRTHPSGQAPLVDRDPRWSTSYVDDFTGTAPEHWYLYSGAPSSGPGGFWAPANAVVRDGELRLRTTYDGVKWVSAGLARTASTPLRYGKVAVRFRMLPATGVSYALLLWPDDEVWPPEIDFGEDGGGTRGLSTATLHHAPGNSIEQHRLASDFAQWHTLGVEWTPGRIDYLIDGRVWASDIGDAVPSTPMHLALQTQTWACGLTFAQCPDLTTPAVTDLEVDWVVVQSYVGP